MHSPFRKRHVKIPRHGYLERGLHVDFMWSVSPQTAQQARSKITWQAMKMMGRGLGVQSNLIPKIPFLGRLLLYLYDTLRTSFSWCFEKVWASRCDEKSVCFFGSGSMAGTQANEWYSHKTAWVENSADTKTCFFCGGGKATNPVSWTMDHEKWSTEKQVIDWLSNI